jgi:hypothetical protein
MASRTVALVRQDLRGDQPLVVARGPLALPGRCGLNACQPNASGLCCRARSARSAAGPGWAACKHVLPMWLLAVRGCLAPRHDSHGDYWLVHEAEQEPVMVATSAFPLGTVVPGQSIVLLSSRTTGEPGWDIVLLSSGNRSTRRTSIVSTLAFLQSTRRLEILCPSVSRRNVPGFDLVRSWAGGGTGMGFPPPQEHSMGDLRMTSMGFWTAHSTTSQRTAGAA